MRDWSIFAHATLLLALVAGFLLPTLGEAVSTEIAGNQVIMEPQDFGLPQTAGTFYNPTGLRVGNELFLYVQGGVFPQNGPSGPGQSGCPGDKILLFKAPWTASGLRGKSNFVRRVSPCTSTDQHYGAGAVFKSGSEYFLPIDKVNFPAADIFKEILLGKSTDAVNWTWTPFVKSTANFSVLDVTLVSEPLSTIFCNPNCHTHTRWWGFFRFGPGNNGSNQVGRMEVDYSQQYPRGFRVWIHSGGIWQQVDDNTGEYGFQPDNFWTGVAPNSLVMNNGSYELWGAKGGVSGCGCDFGNGSTFVYRTASRTGLGPVQPVFSQIRCMPSDNGVGRLFPFRINDPDGKRLLYSSSNDRNCSTLNPNPFVGMINLWTEVDF